MTPQDLRQIGNLLDEKLADIKTDISSLTTDVSELKIDVSELKTDVSELKKDMSIVKMDISNLKDDILRLIIKTTNIEEAVLYQHDTNTARFEKLETKVFGKVTGV